MATANPRATRAAYRADERAAGPTTTRIEKGMSLARAPALVLGTILTAAGLYFLYKAHSFPRFSNFPNGSARMDGKFFFGLFAANGWTGMLTAVAGGLLLFGAAQHLLAKTMSLIVGVALGAAAVIALISGNVLGMAAANGWTELGWAVCAVILLFNTAVPRRRRTVAVAEAGATVGALDGRRRPVGGEPGDPDDARVGERELAPGEPPVTRPDEAPTVADEAPTVADEAPTVADEAPPVARAPGEPIVWRKGKDPAAARREGTAGPADRVEPGADRVEPGE